MTLDDDRCREARALERIDHAFREGDLDALRAALDESVRCRTARCRRRSAHASSTRFTAARSPSSARFLKLGADPNAPVDDGFPPLIAAFSTDGRARGGLRHRDRCRRGASGCCWPLARIRISAASTTTRRFTWRSTSGIWPGVQILLDAGADPSPAHAHRRLRHARGNGAAQRDWSVRRPCSRAGARRFGQRLRSGLTLLADIPAEGDAVRRQHACAIRLRLWLSGGEPVRWTAAWGPVGVARLEDDGATLVTQVHVTRGQLASGLFYGLDGMRVGGIRRLEIAPHQAYGERGVPGVIPPNAVLIGEVTVLAVATAAVGPT